MQHPDPFEGGDRPAATLALGQSLVHPAEHHVLERRAVRQQVERLEHEPEPLGAQPRPFALGQVRHVAAVELVDAGARAVEQAEHVEQRRLARTGRADDGDVLAGGDREIDAAQRPYRRGARKHPLDAAQVDDRHVQPPSSGNWAVI